MMSIHVSIASFIGSGVQPMQQVSSIQVSCRGVGVIVSGLKMPHSIASGQLLSELLKSLSLVLPSLVVCQLWMLLMVVLHVLVVYSHLLYGLLSVAVLCGRSSVRLRCVNICARRVGVLSDVATYASFCLSPAVLYSWLSFCSI